VPEVSVFDLHRLQQHKKFALYNRGVLRLEDVPADYPLNEKQHIQVQCQISGKDHIDIPGIREHMIDLKYPLYFMDFETFQPAVPRWCGARPYQQIPFQYSLHYRISRGGGLQHREFLADAGPDPRPEFIRQLLEDTERPGTIVVYNRPFESGRLSELGRDFPEWDVPLRNRISRLWDLMRPFAAKQYYRPSMNGSHSIKNVLPAVIPEMGYEGLEIQDGQSASLAFESLFDEMPDRKRQKIRNSLRAYCALDTLAMVRLLEVLETLE